jgi:hypothetical protein
MRTARATVIAALLCAAATATTGSAAAPASRPSTEATASTTLARAATIRAQTNARFRKLPGRYPVVTEATTTGVVDSLTLIGGSAGDGRVVPAENGIYFALCPTAAPCALGSNRRSWQPTAFVPRRLGVELALRTFLESAADVVVVSLPTGEPVWLVFERADLLDGIDPSAVSRQLRGRPVSDDTPFRKLILERTRPRLFVPLPVLPPPPGTIYALSLFA